uniref:Uncharacterized protein n=1 Tax=Opuntia streptacantha TaxID=393608 RepID=A0A7C9ALG9_OPUST
MKISNSTGWQSSIQFKINKSNISGYSEFSHNAQGNNHCYDLHWQARWGQGAVISLVKCSQHCHIFSLRKINQPWKTISMTHKNQVLHQKTLMLQIGIQHLETKDLHEVVHVLIFQGPHIILMKNRQDGLPFEDKTVY